MDLATITDLKELKALAFDQIALIEQSQANLRAIQGRIRQLSQAAPPEGEPGVPAAIAKPE